MNASSDTGSGIGSPSDAHSEAPATSAYESRYKARTTAMSSPKKLGAEHFTDHLYRSGTAALVGLCIGVVLLVVSGCLFVDRSIEQQATPTTSLRATTTPPSTTAPPTTAPAATSASVPPAARLGIGVAVGKVTANDGTTLVIKNLTGSSVKVRSNSATKMYVVTAARPADIRVGTVVAVYGQTQSDRSIMANVITGIWIGASAR
ncbi:hypothetical protein [Nocardia sp. Marseille-Q1738]